MAVKSPGFDNSVGNRNRRLGRYGSQAIGAGNRTDRRHKEVRAATIAYDVGPDPDEITDSGDALGGFEVNEVINSQGSTSNDGDDIVQSVAIGALGVDAELAAESAGAAIVLTSRNNMQETRFAEIIPDTAFPGLGSLVLTGLQPTVVVA